MFYVYFTQAIRQLPGFTSQPFPDGSGDKMKIMGLDLFSEGGRFRASFGEDNPIPENLQGVVEEISWYHSIPRMGRREAGIYRHGTAKCELMPGDEGSSNRERLVYKLIVKSKKAEDMNELARQIKAGTIRPEVSYDGAQSGQSRAELEAVVARLNNNLRVTMETAEELSRQLEEVKRIKEELGETLEETLIELDERKKSWYKRLKDRLAKWWEGPVGHPDGE